MADEDISYKLQQIKLRRLMGLNARLKETLKKDRITASNASLLLIDYMEKTPDYLISSIWRVPSRENKYKKYQKYRRFQYENGESGCCTIV